MKLRKTFVCFALNAAAGALFTVPAAATVQIQSLTPSPAPPQVIGSPLTWIVSATDSNTGPLTFQFNLAYPGKKLAMVKDFNVGTFASGVWTSQPLVWTPVQEEGTYQIQVVAKDFSSGEVAKKTMSFVVQPLVTGSMPVVAATPNPLVALFSVPVCPAGSTVRANYTQVGSTTGIWTPAVECGSTTVTFEIAGMRPNSSYQIYGQVNTGGNLVNGPTLTYNSGPLPGDHSFPSFTVNIPAGSQMNPGDNFVLQGPTFPGNPYNYPAFATDLLGNLLWYYYPPSNNDLITRPVPHGVLAIETGPAWNPASNFGQLLREVDWAGNIVKETNTGAIQQSLLAMGAADAQACDAITRPAPIGAGCLDDFDHDFIHSLPNGYYAVIADIEKIFPPGTQGDNSGLPVDIIGNMIIVLDRNWQPVWYFDAFEHDSGAPQLDINRPAILGETCAAGQWGCPPGFLLGPGIAPLAFDWLHGNSLYYWPAPQDGSAKGDLIYSSRHQDWVMRIDYQDGTGTGNILWRMGNQGDFSFNNINNDSWPWFSHQHYANVDANGNMTVFDNGNTRLNQLENCHPNDCNSRGMSVQFDESAMTVTPVLSQDLGGYSQALGSAMLLGDGNYFFLSGYISNSFGQSIEIMPTAGTTSGTQVYNLQSTIGYRAWIMPTLYEPPGN